MYHDLSEDDKSLEFYEQALYIYKEISPENQSEIAEIIMNIGEIYNNLRKNEHALKSYKNALKIYREILPSNHVSISNTLNKIGVVYR